MKPAEEYILCQKEPFRSILMQLQAIIESVVPDSELLFKWRLPFYYVNSIPLCFLNQTKDYVDFAFWHADKMKNYRENFVIENRKSVASLRFKTAEDINENIIIYVLKEQLRINTNPFKLTIKGEAKNR